MALDNDNKTNAPPDQEALGEQVKKLDEDLAELRARFDKFFLGLEKRNPQKDLDEVRKRVQKLKREFVRNTGLKFRIQTLHSKFLSYERLWLKSLKEIEDGTYSRDLFKLRRKKGSPGAEKGAKKADAAAKDDDKKKEKKDSWSLDDGDLEADLPDELFGEPTAPPPPPRPIQRQKTDPALPGEVGGIGAGPRPQSPPPPPTGAVAVSAPAPAVARAVAPPAAVARAVPPPAAAKPPPPPAAAMAGAPIPRQPSKPPQAPVPLPRQATNPPAPPPGAVAGSPKPVARPPAAPAMAGIPRQPTNPPAGAARPPPPPPGAAGGAGGGDGLSNDKVKRIYDAFVTAKKRCKESTDGITLEAVEQSLRKQVPQLMKESGAKSVDFKVVIKDGKAVLKAVPK